MTINWITNKGEPDTRFGPEAPGEGYNAIGFPAAWPDRPWIAANFVADWRGIVVGDNIMPEHLLGIIGLDGRALEPDSGREADQRLMRDFRARADAVMWGANTLRRQPRIIPDLGNDPRLHGLRTSRGLSYFPPLILVTDSGNLDFSLPAFHTEKLRTIVLTNNLTAEKMRAAAGGTKAEIIGIGSPKLDMAGALNYLLERENMKVILCEGGHSLIVSLKELGLLDEVSVTASNIMLDAGRVQNPKYMFDFDREGARLVAYGKAGRFQFRRWRFNER